MRRVVTALVLFTVAMALVACSSDSGTATTPTTPTTGTAVAVPAGTAAATTGAKDIYSPTQTVSADERFPSDKSVVPSAIVTDLAAGKPMIVFYYDPTTKVSSEQRKEIDAAMKKYRGTIDLFALDYTAGVGSTVTSTSLSPEVQKIELLSSALKVNTTPYIVLVDAAGRVVYRFAGFVDRTLLSREVLRATQ